MRNKLILVLMIFSASLSAQKIKNGMVISASTKIQQGVYKLDGNKDMKQPVIIIEGSNITVDFDNSILLGSLTTQQPDSFYGCAVIIRNSNNVLIKNLTARNYKIAMIAENSTNLQIRNCDFSYCYRPRLFSLTEREVSSDWLSYHNNDSNQWMKYGCGIYMKDCRGCELTGITITQSFNGILMTRSEENSIESCNITYNSGVGVGLYRSNKNKVMHNRLDYNVRGFSAGRYRRGQDSGGLLVYEQSNNNIIAFNSATHCGDGLFLWAGQTTLKTGQGGCNDNIIYNNDFSYAPTNGVEATFSRNKITYNVIKGCEYGIWAGYSYNSNFYANRFTSNKYAIAIEHGQNNLIVENMFQGDSIPIKIWANEKQPDWGYIKNHDTKSRDLEIRENSFFNAKEAFHISNTANILITKNYFAEYLKLFGTNVNNTGLSFKTNQVYSSAMADEKTVYPTNKYFGEDEFNGFEISMDEPVPGFEDDCDTCFMPPFADDDVNNIVMNEWGPYNYKYPLIQLINSDDRSYRFKILGNMKGEWTITDSKGFKEFTAKSGNFNTMITADIDTTSSEVYLKLNYKGKSFTTQNGDEIAENQSYDFTYYNYNKSLNWKTNFYNYDVLKQHPLTFYPAFEALKNGTPVATLTSKVLAFNWQDSPAAGVNENHFASFSTADITATGDYTFIITSADGVKVMLDGKEIFSRWDEHEATTDRVHVKLAGKHKIEIIHFDEKGFSTLDFYMTKNM